MSQEVQVIHLLPHSMYITHLTHVNTNNKLQMQRQQPVNFMLPKLENRRQLLREGKDMTQGVTVGQVLGQHLHSFILYLTQAHAYLGRQYYNCVDIFYAQSILFIISDKSDSNSAIILINTCSMSKEGSQSLYTFRGYSCCVTYCLQTCKKQSSCLKSCTTQMAPPTYIQYIQHTLTHTFHGSISVSETQ